jgi:hypothetical protein
VGYTHYWTNTRFTESQWKTACELVRSIIRLSSVEVQYEYDEAKPPQIDDTVFHVIRFNGVDDDGHETFCIERNEVGGFCKTARKPYDEIVVASLFALKHVNPDFSWSSDGDADAHLDGKNLYIRANAQFYEAP